jgi:hypothetical protein
VAAATDRMRVIQADHADRRRPVRAVDLEGTIRLQRSDAVVVKTSAGEGVERMKRMRADMTVNGGNGAVVPDLLLIAGAHIAEIASILPPEQAAALAHMELEGLAPDASVVLVGCMKL